MSATPDPALRRAAVWATRAASIRDTQPWRLALSDDSLAIYADPSRRLLVRDPSGRQMMQSCGCALFNARASLAAARVAVEVQRFPAVGQPDLVARLVLAGQEPVEEAIADLAVVIDAAGSARPAVIGRVPPNGLVPHNVLAELMAVETGRGAGVTSITRPRDLATIAELESWAAELDDADPAYRAEARAWPSAYPPREVDAPEAGDGPCLLIESEKDEPMGWLRTGEARQRLLLEIIRRGYSVEPLTAVIEVAPTNLALRTALRLSMNPQALLRIGRQPVTPRSRRRRMVDVLSEAG